MRRKGIDLQTLAIMGLVLAVVTGATLLLLQNDVIDSLNEQSSGTVGQIEDATEAAKQSASGSTGTMGSFTGSTGPPNEDWTTAFADDFEGGSLDTSKWDVGFGWGMDTSSSYERISEKEVSVSNSELVLGVSHNGGPGSVTAGSVHTKGKHYWEPPVYFEAKLKTPDRHGLLPAFWAKSNKPTPNWPPEIDFFEMLGNNPSSSHHNIHYDASGGMGGNHQSDKMSYDGIDSTTNYHVYGSAWYEDRIEMYVDGEHVGTHDNPTAMQSMMAGAPFYIMLNIHVGKTGEPDFSEQWDDTMHVDWVRVWKPNG